MFQQTEVIGHLGNDPEMRYTGSGDPVTNISVAVKRSWKVGEEWKSVTTWFKVAFWKQQAEYVNKNYRKGDLVKVTGRLADEIEVYNGKGKYELTGDKILRLVKGEGHDENGTPTVVNGNGHAAPAPAQAEPDKDEIEF